MNKQVTIFHLSSETDWRGGEKQLEILHRQLGAEYESAVFAREGSALAERIPVPEDQQFTGSGFFYPLTAFRIRKQTDHVEQVILHAHSSKAVETALLVRLGKKLPLVITRRTVYPVKSGFKYRTADAIIAVSNATREELVKAGVSTGRISIIPDAVDAGQLAKVRPERMGFDDSSFLVVCAAAFSDEKDHATLLEAWSRVPADALDAHLVLLGDGPLLNEMRALVGRRGLQRVHFAGWREDAAELIAGCDLAVLSSKSEGLSSFLCEAQWLGKAVAATNAGGISEAVVDGVTGLLSPVGDAVALARNISVLARDHETRSRYGAAAEKRARMLFDPKRIAEEHKRVYRRLLVGGAG